MGSVDLIIKNGYIVTPTGIFKAGLAIDNGKIIGISGDLHLSKAEKVIDAQKNFVLPGLIDPHVHFRDPDNTECEDWTTATQAAAAGGVTCVIEIGIVESVEKFKFKKKRVEKMSLIDFGFTGIITKDRYDEIPKLAQMGVFGFGELYISGAFPYILPSERFTTDGDLYYYIAPAVAETNRVLAVHAENAWVKVSGEKKMREEGRTDIIAYSEHAPPVSEGEAVYHACKLCSEANTKIHVLHISSKNAAEELGKAKALNWNVTGETLPQYLLITKKMLEKIGPLATFAPAIRGTREDIDYLWACLNNGILDFIGSDHSPLSPEDKLVGADYRSWKPDYDVFKSKSGFIGVETNLPLMLTYGVKKERISLPKYVEISSLNAAKRYNIPNKGLIAPGYDADLVIVDMNQKYTIKSENLHSKTKVTPWYDWQIEAGPLTTISRGEIIFDKGEIIGKAGHGKFISPTE